MQSDGWDVERRNDRNAAIRAATETGLHGTARRTRFEREQDFTGQVSEMTGVNWLALCREQAFSWRAPTAGQGEEPA